MTERDEALNHISTRYACMPHRQDGSSIRSTVRDWQGFSTQVQAAAEPVATAGMAFQELGLAPAALLAVEGALRRGRCGTDADSHAAPRRDPRARRVVAAACTRSTGNGMLPPGAYGRVFRAERRLYMHRPCDELLLWTHVWTLQIV